MALINGIIPKQGFEYVRDAIGAILLIELTNQKTLQGNTLFPEIIEGNILAESLVPEDSAFPLRINVLLDSATYGEMTQKDAMGRTLYFIDIFTSGTSSGDSAFRRDKFLGMIGYIFRSAQYRMLGLPAGLIGGTYIESFATLDPYKKEDTNFTSFARIQLAVRIYENAQAWDGVALVGNNTTVNLEMTDKGYIFVFNS
jgi:hypothetical protein